MKKTIILSVTAALVACAGASYAGTLTLGTGVNPGFNWTIAKEKVDGAASYTTTIPAAILTTGFAYVPSQYGSATISNGALTIKLPAGITIVPSNTNLGVCDGATLVAGFQAAGTVDGSTTNNALIFNAATDGGTGTFTNAVTYTIRNFDCSGPATTTLNVTVPSGTTTLPLTVSTFISSNPGEPTGRDTATKANFIGVITEYSASVTQSMSKKINPASGFKTFTTAPINQDTAIINVAQALIDDRTTVAAGDVTTVVLSTLDNTGSPVATFAAPGAAVCTQSVDFKTLTCTVSAAANLAVGNYMFTLTVNGTQPLNERTFTATSEMNFATALMKDHLISNNTALLNAAPAGAWLLDATTIYVPAIRTDGGGSTSNQETFIRIVTTDTTVSTSVNKVSAILFLDGICNVTLNSGNPIATFGKGLVISGTDLLTAAATGTGTCTTATIGSPIKAFAAKIIVTADKTKVFAYGTQVSGDFTSQRRLPLVVDIEGSGSHFSPANN